MDNDLSKVSSNELLAHGLQNLWSCGKEGGYAVRHGRPVNTFGQPPANALPVDPMRPNFWEQAFPLLYPYGLGGIESDRPLQLSLLDHVQWSLRYHDRRFRTHPTFIFVAFGIHQRRQVLISARVQMKRQDFDRISHSLKTITPEDLCQAGEEEAQG
jgi:hypothetical protein